MIKGLLTSAVSKGKLAKTIKAEKFISNPKEKDKGGSALAKTSGSSIVAKPSANIVSSVSSPSIKKNTPSKGKVDFDYLNNLVDVLVKNTSQLLKNSKSEYKSESKNAEKDRRDEQLKKKKEREETVETKNRVKDEKNNLKIAAPKLPLFDSAFEFLKRFAIGTGVMYLLSILSDPEKKNSLISFLTDNMTTIILGLVGTMGALVLASFIPVVSAFVPVFTILGAVISSLVGLIVPLLTLAAPAIAAAGGLAAAIAAALAGDFIPKVFPETVDEQERKIDQAPNMTKEEKIERLKKEKEEMNWFERYVQGKGSEIDELIYFLETGKTKSYGSQPSVVPEAAAKELRKKIDEILGIKEQETQKKPTPPATPVSSPSQPTRTLIPQSRLPALPPTGTGGKSLAAAQQYGAYRRGGRRHAGQDFDAGPNDTFYSRIGGVVTLVDYNSGGYYNYVDIYNQDLNVTERIAEGDQVLVRKGQTVSAGTPVAKGTNTTGVFHYEIRTGKATTYGFSGTKNPLEFLKGVQSRNPTQIAQQPSPDPAAAVSQYASYEEPAGTPALTPIPIPQQSNQSQVASGSNTMVSPPASKFQVLNSYYNFQVLGFLYKQG